MPASILKACLQRKESTMTIFNTNFSFESSEFIPSGIWEEYQLRKMSQTQPDNILTSYEDVSFTPKVRMENDDAYSKINYPDQHNENASAVVTGPYAGGTNNPFQDPNNVAEEAGKDRNASGKNGLASSFASKADTVKQGVADLKKNFMENPTTKKALEITKNMAVKVQDFTKSSVAKINALPETTQSKMIKEQILDAKEEPRSMAKNLKKGIMSAGKGLAVAGLAITSLPLAAAAVVANKKLDIGTKKQAAEELQHELIRLDGQIQAADQAGEYDKKADLLIAKRTAQQAHAKLKYGLKSKLNQVAE
jgi:hypothetical protein